jgi:hypothetical protein
VSGVSVQFDKNSGYSFMWCPEHPHANRYTGYVKEHIFVMTKFLGRNLTKGENVHHKNGQRSDNRIENLELWSTQQPPGQRVEDKIQWCIEYLSQHGYSIKAKD